MTDMVHRPLEDRPIYGYRTLFLSDFHLGKRHSKVDRLLHFLDTHEAETIYLVGDIFDIWHLNRPGSRWPQAHDRVVDLLMARAEAGVKIIYLPGNHDEILRAQHRLSFGNVSFADRVEHECADGRRYLVIHGDQFDVVLKKAAWLGGIGDRFYDLAMDANALATATARLFGRAPTWSVSALAKHVVKRAVNHASQFETAVMEDLSASGLDGIICGHLHHAEERDLEGLHYLNCGDWVESCTGIVEHWDGRLELRGPVRTGRSTGAVSLELGEAMGR